MRELRRSGFDRRRGDLESEKVCRNRGKDRRALNNNYYQFIKILKKIPIFNNLRVDQFQHILNICAKQAFNEGETIFFEGEESLEMYILINGNLKITFLDGKELSLIKPVGIVGEMGIFTGEPRSASVAAATDCLLLTIHRKELFKVFEKDSFLAIQILMNVIKDLAHKLRNNNVIIDELRQVAFPGDYSKVLSKTFIDGDAWKKTEKFSVQEPGKKVVKNNQDNTKENEQNIPQDNAQDNGEDNKNDETES